MKHVVLVTYGEPISASFIEQLVYSWRILLGLTRTVADIPAPLLPIIALSRARGRNVLWTRNGYSSPLEPITVEQAARLKQALAQQSNDDWTVHVAYEFRVPLLASVIAPLPPNEPIVVVPMYAADSAFTHDLSRTTVEQSGRGRTAPITVLPPISVDALADVSAHHVRQLVTPEAAKSSALVLAAHGTLLQPAKPIETGRVATEQLCAAIQQRLASQCGMVANGWLNHTRGGQWTEPSIDATLKRVSDAGFHDVIYYPYGFLADNAESQLEGQLAAAAQPTLRVRILPCLNDSTALADVIARQIVASSR